MIAKTFQGLEDVLADELISLGADQVEMGRRMVAFEGDMAMMYKANLHLRTALRILKPIATFTAKTPDQVYEQVQKIRWEEYLTTEETFAIDSVVFSDDFSHSKFVTYKVKDAIVDYFQQRYEKRPSVRLTGADLMINLHIAHHTCTLSIDSSGESLHKRGYRAKQTEAPMSEVLAAGILLKTGWNGTSDLIDPMCGSGTLLIEAALIALNIAPGIFRESFAFEKWKDFDRELFEELYNDDSMQREFKHHIHGFDISAGAIQIANENVRSAGLSKYITLQTQPFQRLEDVVKGAMVVMNPPYGERITSVDLPGLYSMIGERLKHYFKGHTVWIISQESEVFDCIGLKPSIRIPLMNGAIDCELRKYEIFDGKYKEFKSEGGALKKDRQGVVSPKGEYKKWEERPDRRVKTDRFENKPREKKEFRSKEPYEKKEFRNRDSNEKKDFRDKTPRDNQFREKRDFHDKAPRDNGFREKKNDESNDRKPFKGMNEIRRERFKEELINREIPQKKVSSSQTEPGKESKRQRFAAPKTYNTVIDLKQRKSELRQKLDKGTDSNES